MKELAKKVKNLNVLIVEDDDKIRKRVANTLGLYFKNVYEADCGYDGYELFIEKKPDLCILDIEMNDGNGIELVKKIRKISLDTPIIMLSAYSKEEYLLELINDKIDHYILKPATYEKLAKAIRSALFKDMNKSLQLTEELYLDLEDNQLLYGEKTIRLRKREKHFLKFLFENKNKIVTYDMIQEYIWGDKFMTFNAVKVFIKDLRKKIPEDIIENIVNEGYKFKS
ncbi:response regulator transcription factor [Poseidonibacter ostreae]|uniref:Response regulator n=1 Tax=Poseidonibacter ostreae TaxID=2654171 RepID=A0A6L4WWM6_9BACT|nr:response regulator transcription factor [Poseidonibacter ostreae]KAB7888848.1 response regulator [Poseidonibacter ostreae]KAB7889661.1 response regulator [Poseidonibacter ostreae]